MYYLGIDAGGSKCAARLVDSGGRVLGEGLSGCAHMRLGARPVFSALQTAWEQSLAQAGFGAEAFDKIRAGVGIAGMGRAEARETLQALSFPFADIYFSNDAEIARLGAHSGRDGGVVIVGTGSVGIGQVSGQEIQIGGYGFPVSDEGSGAWMGLQAIRYTLRASDGRIAGSVLTETLMDRFSGDRRAIIGWMDKATATDYAAFAPVIVGLAQRGDSVGKDILQGAGRHISLMIDSLSAAGLPRIVLCGGLAEVMTDWLEPRSRDQLVPADGDALDGAIWLAKQGN